MILYNTFKKLYTKLVFARCDDMGVARYFTAEDFEGLQTEKYSFKGSKGQKLNGCFYFYDGYDSERIVVFDHGMGGGHLSYMKEIEMLARHGYKVFAYDHTGCMESEGESTVGFTQSLCDLDCCLKTLKSDSCFKDKKFAAAGHSWGGYACLNISAFHPDLTHIIVMSGFVSVEKIAGKFGKLKNYLYAVERENNPGYVDCDAVKSLNNTKAKVLLIYSDNDKMVDKTVNFDYLQNWLSKRGNTAFMLESGKLHNPNYTAEAVGLLGEYASQLSKNKNSLRTPEEKKAFVAGFDWDGMTRQDEKVWEKIFEVLDN